MATDVATDGELARGFRWSYAFLGSGGGDRFRVSRGGVRVCGGRAAGRRTVRVAGFGLLTEQELEKLERAAVRWHGRL
jgi:hypothetical protein